MRVYYYSSSSSVLAACSSPDSTATCTFPTASMRMRSTDKQDAPDLKALIPADTDSPRKRHLNNNHIIVKLKQTSKADRLHLYPLIVTA